MVEVSYHVIYDVKRNEIRIQFNKPEHAKLYQRANNEARIWDLPSAEQAEKDRAKMAVWLPAPQGLKHIFPDKEHGFTFDFENDDAADNWKSKVKLVELVTTSSKTIPEAVYGEWTEKDFKKVLRFDDTQ